MMRLLRGRGRDQPPEVAIELYFDAETESAILGLRDALYDAGIVPDPGLIEARPHLSLTILQGDEIPFGLLRAFAADTPPRPVQLTSLSTFPGESGIVFLAPTPDDRLLDLHRDLHERLRVGAFAYRDAYAPDAWVPHCTLEKDIPREQVPQAIAALLQAFAPLTGSLAEIGAVRYPPLEAIAIAQLGSGSAVD